MLRGEESRRGLQAVVLGVVAAIVAGVVLWGADRYETALVDPEPVPVALSADLAVTEQRVDVLEMDIAASSAAVLLLQAQDRNIAEAMRAQTAELVALAAEITELKAALAATTERLARAGERPRRPRKAVPDPPASSYLKLQ